MFDTLFSEVQYDFKDSQIVKDILNIFGNQCTTKDMYWALAQSWNQAKSNLFRNAIGLHNGQIVNNAGVQIRLYDYNIDPSIRIHLANFNQSFGQLPPV